MDLLGLKRIVSGSKKLSSVTIYRFRSGFMIYNLIVSSSKFCFLVRYIFITRARMKLTTLKVFHAEIYRFVIILMVFCLFEIVLVRAFLIKALVFILPSVYSYHYVYSQIKPSFFCFRNFLKIKPILTQIWGLLLD